MILHSARGPLFRATIVLAFVIFAAPIQATSHRGLLQSAQAPGVPSRIISNILGQGVPTTSLGATVPQQQPVSEAPNNSFDPTSLSRGSTQILFACRAIGQQAWTPGADGKHNNTGAQADLWCGPTATSKISVKHFFSGLQSNGVRSELFVGGAPTFAAVNGEGIVVAKALTKSAAAPSSSRDGMGASNGGFGSVPDTLLQMTEANGIFSDVRFIVRNNELGGELPSGLTPLPVDNANLQNFGPTGAEGKPNAALLIPYQADYTFFTGSMQPFLMARGYSGTAPVAGLVASPTINASAQG